MRLFSSSILTITCVTCLGLVPSQASTRTYNIAPEILELASASATDTVTQPILQPGTTGQDVQAMQIQLKKLGYYDGEIDGKYGTNTLSAVSKFQSANKLIADGVAGSVTRKRLQQVVAAKQDNTLIANISQQTIAKKPQQKQDLLWWLLVGTAALGSIGACLYIVRFGKGKKYPHQTIKPDISPITPPLQQDTTNDGHFNNNAAIVPQQVTAPPPTELLPPQTTSRLTKVNIVDELVKDLRSPDATKRRKAIWDLGQQGDSRAIQPLMDLMIDADSQQRSLILGAMAEIGSRTLKPMNRALAMSLQDESPQVRQNAIRDLTRIYDMMSQISQMLCHAVEDPDAEVQATARYAISQMNRIRALPGQEMPSDLEDDEPESFDNYQN